jgi:hypothetical protein
MKAIILALALLLFTSPVHANSIDGKAIFCSWQIHADSQRALKNRTRDREKLDRARSVQLMYTEHFIFEDGRANKYLLDEKNPNKIVLFKSSDKYSVFPFKIKWEIGKEGSYKISHTLDRETLVRGTWMSKYWSNGKLTYPKESILYYNCWLTTKDAIFEELRLEGERVKKQMKKNKL